MPLLLITLIITAAAASPSALFGRQFVKGLQKTSTVTQNAMLKQIQQTSASATTRNAMLKQISATSQTTLAKQIGRTSAASKKVVLGSKRLFRRRLMGEGGMLCTKALACAQQVQGNCMGDCTWDTSNNECEPNPALLMQFMMGNSSSSSNPMMVLMVKSSECSSKTEQGQCTGDCQWNADENSCDLDGAVAAAAMMGGEDCENPMMDMMLKSSECSSKMEPGQCTGDCQWNADENSCDLDGAVAAAAMMGGGDDAAGNMDQIQQQAMTCSKKSRDSCSGDCEWQQEQDECDLSIAGGLKMMGCTSGGGVTDDASPVPSVVKFDLALPGEVSHYDTPSAKDALKEGLLLTLDAEGITKDMIEVTVTAARRLDQAASSLRRLTGVTVAFSIIIPASGVTIETGTVKDAIVAMKPQELATNLNTKLQDAGLDTPTITADDLTVSAPTVEAVEEPNLTVADASMRHQVSVAVSCLFSMVIALVM